MIPLAPSNLVILFFSQSVQVLQLLKDHAYVQILYLNEWIVIFRTAAIFVFAMSSTEKASVITSSASTSTPNCVINGNEMSDPDKDLDYFLNQWQILSSDAKKLNAQLIRIKNQFAAKEPTEELLRDFEQLMDHGGNLKIKMENWKKDVEEYINEKKEQRKRKRLEMQTGATSVERLSILFINFIWLFLTN